jgi:membrane-bound metal-dependent hydrolase YbcI (DUF457 family)
VNSRAGVVTAQVGWLALLPHVPQQNAKTAVAGFVVAAVTSYLPDLDHDRSTAGQAVGRGASRLIRRVAGGHRGGTHSLFAVTLAFEVTALVLVSFPLALAAAVGLGAHLFCDLLTRDGLSWLFWPFFKVNLRLGTMRTGSVHEARYVRATQGVGIGLLLLYGYQFLGGVA